MPMRIFFLFSIALALKSNAALDVGVRAQSLGGAIRAQGSSNDVIYYNPAALIKYRRVSPEVNYLYFSHSDAHMLGASVVDSSTSAWGLGFGYNAQFFPKKDLPSAHTLYASTAMPLGTDLLSLGFSLSYVYDTKIGPDPYAHFFNTDIGLMTSLPIGFSLAIVADHIFKPKGREKSLGLSIGSAFDFSALVPLPLSLSFDWSMDDVKSDGDLAHILSTGAQFIVLSILPLRAGFKANINENKKMISLGAGLISGPLLLDGLYSQDISMGKNRYFGLALGINIE